MNKDDKAFCVILALIIGGCVSDDALKKWHDVKTKEIQLEQDRLFVIENEAKK